MPQKLEREITWKDVTVAVCASAAILGFLIWMSIDTPEAKWARLREQRKALDPAKTLQTHIKAPLRDSEYLANVREPIAMTDAIRWDNGSIDLSFKDADGKSWALGTEVPFVGPTTLKLGYDPKNNIYGTHLAIRSPEEQATLGLLRRWYRDNPRAIEWNRMVTDSEVRSLALDQPRDLAELLAVLILRDLHDR